MMQQTIIKLKIITLIAIPSVLVFLMFYPSLAAMFLQIPIDITGTVDYTGIPEMDGAPAHGYRYFFFPDQEDISKLGKIEADRLTLIGGKLIPELDGKKVRVHGSFIEDYVEYKSKTYQPRWSGDPGGAVIIVKDIQILEDNKFG